MKVPSNKDNSIEHLTHLILSRMQVEPADSLEGHAERAVEAVYNRSLSTFRSWCRHVDLPCPKCNTSAQLVQLMLWYLIWGEAGNLRHMPELLCFLVHCAIEALENVNEVNLWSDTEARLSNTQVSFAHSRSSSSCLPTPSVTRSLPQFPRFKAATQSALRVHFHLRPSDGRFKVSQVREEHFLSSIVQPIYRFMSQELLERKADSFCNRSMYDDVNEFFWFAIEH